MASDGWYPDPAGAAGRYRYWDGEHWSAETTDDPRTPPPDSHAGSPLGSPPGALRGSTADQPATRRAPAESKRGLLIVGLILLVVLAVVGGVILLRQHADDASGADDPSSTVSGWDDSSPFPTATPSSPRASASPSPSPTRSRSATPTATTSAAPPPQSVLCPTEDQTPAAHPVDGRVHGGHLSFAQVTSYPAPETDPQFSWMTDVLSQTQPTEPGWISIFAVGQVETSDDGFATPRQAAESSIECAITEGWYEYFSGRTDLKNEAITIGGHRGWIISSDVRVANPNIRATGDQLTFVVIDDGRPDALSVWCGMVPIGDTARLGINDAVLAGLRVD